MIIQVNDWEVTFKKIDVSDMLIMMGEMKISPLFFANIENFSKSPDYFTFIGNMIKRMGTYFLTCKSGEVAYDKWEDVLENLDSSEVISLASDFVSKLLSGSSKKKP